VKNAGAAQAGAPLVDRPAESALEHRVEPGAAGAATDDAPTRERVAHTILQDGPSTAASLAERLDLTPAAIRRHLEQLVEEGMIEAREPRVYGHRVRGRPAKVFVVTDAGRDAFYQAYDDLAVSALRFLAENGGPEAVQAFARRRVADLEERYAPAVSAADEGDRARVLAEALTEDGYAASVQDAHTGPNVTGLQLCQHNCPVAHVAAEFPQLCEAETEVFARLLGRHVQRLATIAHGDGVCTTHVPDPNALRARSTSTGRKDTP
jgi:predicted ArsR family transcriptional regulator